MAGCLPRPVSGTRLWKNSFWHTGFILESDTPSAAAHVVRPTSELQRAQHVSAIEHGYRRRRQSAVHCAKYSLRSIAQSYFTATPATTVPTQDVGTQNGLQQGIRVMARRTQETSQNAQHEARRPSNAMSANERYSANSNIHSLWCYQYRPSRHNFC